MAEWKDRRKNIYTVTVVHRGHGYISHIETHSNKKKAEARLARMVQLYAPRATSAYEVKLHTTKLQRKSQWE